jgi:RNA polymerase sigma-70 factor, ECF subfamily
MEPMDHQRNSGTDRLDEFVRLLAEHDRATLLFILSLVPNWADAEEIRQETSVKLWQEFGKFQPGTDFGKWARTIARYEVLTFKTHRQHDRIHLSQRSMDLVAAEVDAAVCESKDRQLALAECVEELGAFHHELLRLYYTVGWRIREIARELHCSSDAVYKALQRVRSELRRCVDRKLREGGPA